MSTVRIWLPFLLYLLQTICIYPNFPRFLSLNLPVVSPANVKRTTIPSHSRSVFQAVVPTLSRSVSCRRRRKSVSVESSISDDSSTIYDDLRAVPAGQSGTIAFHARPTAINNDDYNVTLYRFALTRRLDTVLIGRASTHQGTKVCR